MGASYQEELAKTAVQITCYDKDGKEIKRVTSADDGTVEEGDGGDFFQG